MDQLRDMVEAMAERARQRVPGPDGEAVEALIRRYYLNVGPDDLAGCTIDDLYGAALCHWQLARRRAPGAVNIRVYTPSIGEDGWQSPHSVVDVVTDDMPFLLDSTTAALERMDIGIHLLAHPVLAVSRHETRLRTIAGAGADGGEIGEESFLHLEIDRLADDAAHRAVEERLRAVLADVRLAVRDWQPMRARALELAAELDEAIVGVDDDERSEVAAFLRFLVDDHFTFIGYREYGLDDDGALVSIDGTGLGVLAASPPSRKPLSDLAPEGAARALEPTLLNLTKANARSTVHRGERLDYVGLKLIDESGHVVRERRFIGLFAARVYSLSVTEIPLLRRKVDAVLAHTGDQASSHDHTTILAILEDYPRDELLDAPLSDLIRIVAGILYLRERRRVKLFTRRDIYGRFTSCLVYVPRDRYNTEVRERIQALLCRELGGTDIIFDSQVSGAVLARVHVTVFTDPRNHNEIDVAGLEREIGEITANWIDDLRDALVAADGEALGLKRFERYGRAFPGAYRDEHRAAVAAADIERLEALQPGELSVNLYRPLEADERTVRFKLYRVGDPITLSDVLPLLQHLGVTVIDERPYVLGAEAGRPASIYDFGLRLDPIVQPVDDRGDAFEQAFLAVWDGRSESDGFNRLVLIAGLDWREVAVLRAFRRYLRQIGSTFSQDYYESTLCAHPGLARLLVDAFHARFDPRRTGAERAEAIDACQGSIDRALALVPNLDEDRMLRSFASLVSATVRTNFYQRDGRGLPRPALALKLDPRQVPDMPLPRPAHEIFVYSPTMEGTHLRSARIARGGIRWSERREDFRTEILGLMKAQMVKNAVIVPAGAKGGFVAKRLNATMSGDEVRAEVLAAYRVFIGSLLDVTDDLVDGKVVPPATVIRLDGDDPYLVVAADKGTATFSDVANAIAHERGYWLGDAFASGGSSGYDHKAMAITAKGAWESVKRHFRELGVDISTQPFTTIGIGDMSGDVFGNGVLLSRQMRLLAAFDHRHVFVDPDPDPDASYDERRRLFDLPRSSWADYDATCISAGGGVFDRTAKSIAVSPEMRQLLGLPEHVGHLTPPELIRALLTAPVDLLWNGGIGTFVKARRETHSDVGDRGNDAIRVDADDLRCRVVGEGGNLGFTEAARVAFARSGGKIYSDAIDNAAGVNCSDHEVNIKILLNAAVADGDLTIKQRDALLVAMTSEVSELVLAENYRQTAAISAARVQAPGMVEVHQRHLQWLERTTGLDRVLEGLPSDDELNERREAGQGLAAPELAVLLAHTKIALTADLVASDLPRDGACAPLLAEYFPTPLRERFAERIRRHPLARELVATLVTNRLVDRAGLSMTHRLAEETSAPVADIARAHLAAWQIFDLQSTWDAVNALDNVVDCEVQLRMLLETKRLGERATRWLLRNQRLPLDVEGVVTDYRSDVGRLRQIIPETLRRDDQRSVGRTAHLIHSEGVPADLLREITHMDLVITALDIIEVARSTGVTLEQTAATYLALDDDLRLGWLRQRINGLPRNDRWESLARSALRDDFFRAHVELTESILASPGPDASTASANDPVGDLAQPWIDGRRHAVEHCLTVLSDIRASGRTDLAQLSVAVRELRNLIHVAQRDTSPSP